MSYKMYLSSKEQLKQKKCTFCDHYKMFHPSGVARCQKHDATLLNLDGCPDWSRQVATQETFWEETEGSLGIKFYARRKQPIHSIATKEDKP